MKKFIALLLALALVAVACGEAHDDVPSTAEVEYGWNGNPIICEVDQWHGASEHPTTGNVHAWVEFEITRNVTTLPWLTACNEVQLTVIWGDVNQDTHVTTNVYPTPTTGVRVRLWAGGEVGTWTNGYPMIIESILGVRNSVDPSIQINCEYHDTDDSNNLGAEALFCQDGIPAVII